MNTIFKQTSLRTLIFTTLIAVTGFLIYANTFDAAMVLDDNIFIIDNPPIHITELNWESLKKAAIDGHPKNRFLPKISFAVNYYFHGLDPAGYHLVNLFIHLLNGLVLFLFIRLSLRLHAGPNPKIQPDILAFFAAMLWLTLPVNSQAVTYLCQRMAAMVALFYLLSLFFYAKARTAMKKRKHLPRYAGQENTTTANMISAPRHSGRGSAATETRNPAVFTDKLIPFLYFTGCALAAICAFATKENAGTLPLMILLYEWFFFQNLKLRWSSRHLLWAGFFLVLFTAGALWFLGDAPLQRILNSYNIRNFSPLERVMTEWRIIIYYISLFLWPSPDRLNLDHNYPVSPTLFTPPTTFLALAAILGLFAISILAARKNPLAAFCILWFFITQATESTLIGLELIFEHRTYIPFMMTGLLLAMGLCTFLKNQKAILAALSLIVLLFSTGTFLRNQTFQNPIDFWTDCVAKSPDKMRPHEHLGVELVRNGQVDEGIRHYRLAMDIDPVNSKLQSNYGKALILKGDADLALTCLQNAVMLLPDRADARYDLGTFLFKQGRLEAAIPHLEKAVALEPENQRAHFNLANTYFQKKNYEKALFHAKKTTALDPVHEKAHQLIGNILFEQEKYDQALTHFNTVLRINPASAAALRYKGLIFLNQQDINQAYSTFKQAQNIEPDSKETRSILQKLGGMLAKAEKRFHEQLTHHPDREDIHFQLGRIYQALDMPEKAINHYQQAIKINPEFVNAIYSLAAFYAEKGQYPAAITVMQRAAGLAPRNPIHAYNMACLYSKNNDTQDALTWLNRALENGYDNLDRLVTDKDLESIRHLPEFKRIIKKYWPNRKVPLN